MKQGLVSVVIPTYNRKNKIINAIDSVIRQTYNNWEIIVVDDFSTDDSYRILSDAYNNDMRIRIYTNESLKGPSGARNTGISKANGEYVAFLDSDDMWEFNHLEIGIEALKKTNTNVFMASWYIKKRNGATNLFFDNKKFNDIFNRTVKDMSPQILENYYCFDSSFYEYMIIQISYFYHINTVVLRKTALDSIRGFNEKLRSSEDVEFISRCIRNYGFCYDKNPHFTYCLGDDNIYNFLERDEIDLFELINDAELTRKMIFCDINKCKMLRIRMLDILLHGSIKNRYKCMQACAKKLSAKYFTMAVLSQKSNRIKSYKYAALAIFFNCNKYHVKMFFKLLLLKKNENLTVEPSRLNFN